MRNYFREMRWDVIKNKSYFITHYIDVLNQHLCVLLLFNLMEYTCKYILKLFLYFLDFDSFHCSHYLELSACCHGLFASAQLPWSFTLWPADGNTAFQVGEERPASFCFPWHLIKTRIEVRIYFFRGVFVWVSCSLCLSSLFTWIQVFLSNLHFLPIYRSDACMLGYIPLTWAQKTWQTNLWVCWNSATYDLLKTKPKFS